MEEEEFIANYMSKHMKDHGLHYGFAYINLEMETEEKAKKAWKAYLKRNTKK